MKYIGGEGPLDAKIVVVGEAPGEEEEITGRPFVGKIGKELNLLLSSAGIHRKDIYLTNVVKYRPPNNKLARLDEFDMTIESFYPELKTEIEKINPNVVFAVGGVALTALCDKTGIKTWRGSILESTLIPGQKVIPTIHPSSAIRGEIELLALISADCDRVLRESKSPGFESIPKRTYILNPTFSQVIHTLDLFKENALFLPIDIENIPYTDIVTEIGLGNSSTFGITIPIYKRKAVWTPEEEKLIWEKIKELCTNPNIYKTIQNNTYEKEQLFKWLGEIYPIYSDPMIGMHLCYIEMPKTLNTISSIFSNEPHWKTMKTAEDYNIKDVVVIQEIVENIDKELEEENLFGFMHGFQMPFAAIMWRASKIGICVDLKKMEEYREQAIFERDSLQQIIDAQVGYPLNVSSPKQVANLLYIELKLPIQREKGKITTNEKALLRLQKKVKNPILNLIIEVRQARKALSTYLNTEKVDSDGRLHTEWVMTGTKTGRISSRMNIRETGWNMQNLPNRIRDIFYAPEGRIFVVGDLKQADARFVAWISGDLAYKGMFKEGKDIHNQVAGWIFKKSPDLVQKEERRRAKATAHGAPYGMGAKTISALYNIPVNEAEWLKAQYFHMFPDVKTNYQEVIVEQLRTNRRIYNPFGRYRDFFSWWNDALFREAYAYPSQGGTADLIDMAAVRIDIQLPDSAYILLQVHDELVIECDEGDADKIARIFKKEVEQPIIINGDEMIMPVEIGIGKTWHKDNLIRWEG